MSKKTIPVNNSEGAGRASPAVKCSEITPSDTVDLIDATRGLFVGTAGDIKCIFANDDDADVVTMPNVPVGFHPMSVRRIFATGTTAADLFSLR